MKKNTIVRNKALDYTVYLRIVIKLLTQILKCLSAIESLADTKPSAATSTAETKADTKQSPAEIAAEENTTEGKTEGTYVKWPDERDQQKQWIPPMHGWLANRSRNNW
jgi:hypothetical protein